MRAPFALQRPQQPRRRIGLPQRIRPLPQDLIGQSLGGKGGKGDARMHHRKAKPVAGPPQHGQRIAGHRTMADLGLGKADFAAKKV